MRNLLLSAPVMLAVMAATAHAQQPPMPQAGEGVELPAAAPQAPVPSAAQLPDYMVPVGAAAANPVAYGMHPGQAANMPAVAPVYQHAQPVQAQPVQAVPVQAAQGQYIPGVTGVVPGQAPQVLAPQAQAPQAQAPQPPSPAELAFQQALQSMYPMSPDMIRQFKGIVDQSQRAVAAPVGEPPKPVSRSVELTLKPGERAPQLRLYPGNATTLTFSDLTGQPWPVMSVTVGNPTAYQAIEAGEKGKTNMVVISPLSYHAVANNLVVTLVNHPVPIIFTLETGKAEVDYRLDVGIQGRGPNATYDIVSATTLPPTNDANVQAFLDGVAPKGARKVVTSNRDVEAWRFNDMLYVRTPLELLSPAYVGRARNVSGVNVYTMIDSPVLLVSQDGRMASVSVEP